MGLAKHKDALGARFGMTSSSRNLVPGQPADFISRSLAYEVSSSDAFHAGQQCGRWVSALDHFFIQTLAIPPHSARAYVGRAEARRFRVAPIKAPKRCAVHVDPATKWRA
eukprot:6114156-Pyramimonas_sp.AAC.1